MSGILAAATAAILLTGHGALAQSFDRTPYTKFDGWLINTYRAADSGEFLRCSAERHLEDAPTLTIARTAASKFVLGVTSAEWTFDDRSTPATTLQVDENTSTSLAGRVRILPNGPMLFIDVEAGSSLMDELAAGNTLTVSAGETQLQIPLAGSAAAIATTIQCHQDAID